MKTIIKKFKDHFILLYKDKFNNLYDSMMKFKTKAEAKEFDKKHPFNKKILNSK